MNELELTLPDDWHIHLRDDQFLARTVSDASQQFGRILAMPNLKPPVIDVASAVAYHQRIQHALPMGSRLQPYLTLYLTQSLTLAELRQARQQSFILGCKLYPAGATTHSDAGVRNLQAIYPLLAEMEALGLVLQIHGEVTDPEVDVFDREARFIEQHLIPISRSFPGLKVVLEHITTQDAVEFIQSSSSQFAATLTPQHLLYNRNAIFQGGLRPHYYCLPVLKRERHRQALLTAATSGDPHFFLGTDSAPHAQSAKESACGCAGIYSAHAALEFYAQAFDSVGALDKLEAFASHFGADFYGLPRNTERVKLVRQPQTIAAKLDFGDTQLIPLGASDSLPWQLVRS